MSDEVEVMPGPGPHEKCLRWARKRARRVELLRGLATVGMTGMEAQMDLELWELDYPNPHLHHALGRPKG
jgi:hypothetical protein